MKKIESEKIIKVPEIYSCDFCGRSSGLKKMQSHEAICYKNPNRNCRVCDNTGIKIKSGDTCDACIIANKCGGKSYL